MTRRTFLEALDVPHIKLVFSGLDGRAICVPCDEARRIAADVRGLLSTGAEGAEVTFRDPQQRDEIRSTFNAEQAKRFAKAIEEQAARADRGAAGHQVHPIGKVEKITRDDRGEIAEVETHFVF